LQPALEAVLSLLREVEVFALGLRRLAVPQLVSGVPPCLARGKRLPEMVAAAAFVETWRTRPPPLDIASGIAARQSVLEIRGLPIGRVRWLERPALIDRDRCIEAVADTGEGARSRGKLVANTRALPGSTGTAALSWFVARITWWKWAHLTSSFFRVRSSSLQQSRRKRM